jgi:hypothetical protein
MGATGMRALRRELEGPVPRSLAALEDEDLEDLARALRERREHQSAALAKATEDSLGFVPRLLRGPLRRVLFG